MEDKNETKDRCYKDQVEGKSKTEPENKPKQTKRDNKSLTKHSGCGARNKASPSLLFENFSQKAGVLAVLTT